LRQLREIGGKVEKAPPKDGSYRILDIPPFLADLLRWAVKNRRPKCACPASDGRPVCKGEDETKAHYLFLGPRGGHPRRSNYADRIITPAAEGLHPKRKGTRRPVYIIAEPWPGIPIRKGNRKNKAADPASANGHSVPQSVPQDQERPSSETGERACDLREPPIGIEPMTYSLRVNRSGRLS
jgi:hypothetical protein